MFTLIIIFLILLPITFLRLILTTSFSSAELSEMGVCLENIEMDLPNRQLLLCDSVATKMTVACINP